MEVTSRFIESADLGQLHVTSFSPNPNKMCLEEQTILFSSLNGRITTLDSFGFAYKVAETMSTITHFVERPGTGFSSLPEDNALRESMRRHGFIELADVVLDTVSENLPGMRKAKLRLGGFSAGGAAAALALWAAGNRAVAHEGFDEPALIDTSSHLGTGRFIGYTALAELAQRASIAPSTRRLFADVIPEFETFLTTTGLADPEKPSKEARQMETNEVMRTTRAEGLRSIEAAMYSAAERQANFELRLGFSNARVLTDHQVAAAINKSMDFFDAKFPNNTSVQYGFLWGGPIGRWHHMASRPEAVKALLGSDIGQLAKRIG